MRNKTNSIYGWLALAWGLMLGAEAVRAAPACEVAIDENVPVVNYTNFYPYAGNAFFQTYYSAPASESEARDRLAELYSRDFLPATCIAKVRAHLDQKKPNVYIYIGGFGQHVQLNDTYIDAAEVVKWVNARDPNALVISLGWDCGKAVAAGQAWCQTKSDEFFLKPSHPVRVALKTATTGAQKPLFVQLEAVGAQSETGYNLALAASIESATHLIDHVVRADIGDVRIIGYSMGAQSLSEILTTDLDADPATFGFKWSTPNACEDGTNACVVSQLKKMKWTLALGLPGWARALRASYNGFDEFTGAASPEAEARREDFANGGLFRVQDYRALVPQDNLIFNNKLTVFNKRQDPTSIADDTYQRGIGDVFYNEYNHYGHDYNRPFFWSPSLTRLISSYVESSQPRPLLPLGAIWEAGALFDFDEPDCAGATCRPTSYYAAHTAGLNSHANSLFPMKTVNPVAMTDGVPHAENTLNRAALLTAGGSTLKAYSMDQQDLRGSVEFFFRPDFDVRDGQLHGLFSYGSCGAQRADDLLPRAYFEDNTLTLEMMYRGQNYTAVVPDVSRRPEFATGKWVHLSFNWDLPTQSLREFMSHLRPANRAIYLRKYGAGLALAAGLLRDPSTTYRVQKGKGQLSILVNGVQAVSADFGKKSSFRDCLPMSEVLSENEAALWTDAQITVPAYNPYRSYGSDDINLGNGQNIGKKCKAYRIRNEEIQFGCAKTTAVTADGAVDDVHVIYGKPRTKFPEVNADGTSNSWQSLAGLAPPAMRTKR